MKKWHKSSKSGILGMSEFKDESQLDYLEVKNNVWLSQVL